MGFINIYYIEIEIHSKEIRDVIMKELKGKEREGKRKKKKQEQEFIHAHIILCSMLKANLPITRVYRFVQKMF